MPTPTPPDKDFARVVAMAQACNVDLSTALDQGQIAATAYTDLVFKCRGCSQSGACDSLLATAPALSQAPDYCVNRADFAHLRQVQTG